MPSSCQRRTISIARRSEDKMALPSGLLFLSSKNKPSLCGDTDTDNLFPANAGMGKQFANDSHAAFHPFYRSGLCRPGCGLMRTAAGAAHLPLAAFAVIQPGFQPATAANVTPASIASWFIAPHPRLSVNQHPAEHLLQTCREPDYLSVAKGFAVEISND